MSEIQVNPPDIIKVVSGTQKPIKISVVAGGPRGKTGAQIISASFNDDDIDFTLDDETIVSLVGAKIALKGTEGDPGIGLPGDKGDDGHTPIKDIDYFDGIDGKTIVSAAFDGNDLVFILDDDSTVTLINAKIQLKGSQGDPGEPGAPGETPVKGIDYFDGITPVKDVDYFDGEDGADGKTIVSAAFVSNDIVFTLSDESIVTLTNAKITLKGNPGDPGAPGSTPVKGVDYFDGEDGYTPIKDVDYFDGTNGSDGKTVRNGSGVPSSGLGVDGDFYIDTATNNLYGPKAGGSWGSGVSLVGTPGIQGDPGMSRFTFVLHRGENATVGNNKTNAIIIERACTITKAYAYAITAPTGAALIFDINKNGATIWSTQGNRLQIAAGQNSGTQTNFNTTALAEGDLLMIDIDQIGSTLPGADITVVLKVE